MAEGAAQGHLGRRRRGAIGNEPREQGDGLFGARFALTGLADADDRRPLGQASEGPIASGRREHEGAIEQHDRRPFGVERMRLGQCGGAHHLDLVAREEGIQRRQGAAE